MFYALCESAYSESIVLVSLNTTSAQRNVRERQLRHHLHRAVRPTAHPRTNHVDNFALSLTAILVSRFLFDLQETSHAATDDADTMRLSTDFRVSGLNFAPILGSLGSTVSGGSMPPSADQWGTQCDEEDGTCAGIRMDVIEKPIR